MAISETLKISLYHAKLICVGMQKVTSGVSWCLVLAGHII